MRADRAAAHDTPGEVTGGLHVIIGFGTTPASGGYFLLAVAFLLVVFRGVFFAVFFLPLFFLPPRPIALATLDAAPRRVSPTFFMVLFFLAILDLLR